VIYGGRFASEDESPRFSDEEWQETLRKALRQFAVAPPDATPATGVLLWRNAEGWVHLRILTEPDRLPDDVLAKLGINT